jgi:hypothetical protein
LRPSVSVGGRHASGRRWGARFSGLVGRGARRDIPRLGHVRCTCVGGVRERRPPPGGRLAPRRAELPAPGPGALWPPLHPGGRFAPRPLAPCSAADSGLSDLIVGARVSPRPRAHWTGTPGLTAFPCSVRSQRDDPGPSYRTGVVLSLSAVEAIGLRIRCFACHWSS